MRRKAGFIPPAFETGTFCVISAEKKSLHIYLWRDCGKKI
ncbi:hypothetical protein HMPREF3038_00298 [Akkermansia sp. KLE1797]|nr:hypothetical protein HMPREF3038_00298 [Akkermansia sp. KLE1797]